MSTRITPVIAPVNVLRHSPWLGAIGSADWVPIGLHLDEPADAFAALPAAQSGVLHPAHRGVDAAERRREPLVDVDGAAVDLAGDPPTALGVGGPDTGVQSVLGVVGPGHRLRVVGDRIDADHRPEGLVRIAVHLRGDAGEHGRLVEQLAEIGPRAPAGQHGGSLGSRVLDVLTDPVQLAGVDQSGHVVLVVHGAAEPEGLRPAHETPGEGGQQRLGDVDPLGGHAELAGVGEAGPHRALGRRLDVGVVQDQQRVLSAQLQRAADQPVGALGRHLAAGGRRPGEADVVADLDQLRSDQVARPVHHRPEVGRHAGYRSRSTAASEISGVC